MVRGNYQCRIEKAEARRLASRQIRKKRDNRSVHKAMAQKLLVFLEKHAKSIRRRADPTWTLHMWTDSIPSSGSQLIDVVEELDGKGGGKGRGRGASFGEEKKEKSQIASSSDAICGSAKKKVHPRSKVADDSTGDDDVFAPVLCKFQFFTGKCDDLKGGKKGCCRFTHYPKRSKTLAEVLKINKNKDAEEVEEMLAMSSQSLLTAIQELGVDIHDAGGMEMLYYSAVDLVKITPDLTNDDDNDLLAANAILSRFMAENSIAASNVVYVAINDILIFDRYRNGIIISDHTMMTAVLGDEGRRSRAVSLALSIEGKAVEHEAVAAITQLPVHILEDILTYLPDQSTPIMSRVCRAWNSEIVSSSPELWRHILRRRGWPIADEIDDVDELRERLKADFLLHYTVVRDIAAVKDALGALLGGGKKTAFGEAEMVYQAFSTRRTAPQEFNECVTVEVWSSNQTLVAYAQDCTLRLFKAIDKSLEGGSPRSCREIVCVCVDPFRKTKKQTTTLIAMALDEDTISCLCCIQAGLTESYILTAITRDDYLSSDGNSHNDALGSADLEEGVINVIDLGDTVLNYVVSLDDADHLPRLSTYFAEGGELADIGVRIAPSLHACGFGRFLLEVSIFLPDVDYDDNTNRRSIFVGSKLVMICASRGIIFWMGDTNPFGNISCIRSTSGALSSRTCSIVATSASSPVIVHTVIEASGRVQPQQTIEAAEIFWSELHVSGWDTQAASTGSKRPIVITDTDVVVAYCLRREVEGEKPHFKTFVSFYPRISEDISYQAIQLVGNCSVVGMKALRDQHVAIFCVIYVDSDLAQMNGHWFSEPEEHESFFCILLHVPTRREIHRVCLSEGNTMSTVMAKSRHIPLQFSSNGATIGVGIFWKGVMMTGSDVRDLGENFGLLDESALKLSRKKNAKSNRKRNPKSNSKQDGYARGMSMQG